MSDLYDYAYANRLQAGKANQVGAQTEACALASREANAGGQQIQESEGDGGDDGNGQHLLQIQLLLGDDEGGQRNCETLEEILDRTRDELCNSETVHLIISAAKILAVGPLSSNASG